MPRSVPRAMLCYFVGAIIALVVALLTPVTWYQALIFWFLTLFCGILIAVAAGQKARDETGIGLLLIALCTVFTPGWPGWYALGATVLGVVCGWCIAIKFEEWVKDEEEDDSWPS